MGDLRVVPLELIHENEVALREVNRESEQYLGLVDSIRNKGFLGAITVREQTDEAGETYLELIDGLHRFNAAKDAGLEEINVDIVALDDANVLEAQIMANIHKVETRPIEYSQQLRRIFASNALLTVAELASRLGKSSQWLKERLSLNKIENPEIQKLVDDGEITLANAYSLAKLPPEEQPDYIQAAIEQPTTEFAPTVQTRVKEINEARRKGREAAAATFTPQAFMQKMKDVKAEYESGEVGAVLAPGHEAAFRTAIEWVLHLDERSVENQRVKWEEKRRLKAEKKAERDAERARKAVERAEKQKADAAEKAAAAEAALAEMHS